MVHHVTNTRQLDEITKYICEEDYFDLFKLKDARGWTVLHRVAWRDNVNVACSILGKLAEQKERDQLLEYCDRDGKTPLHWVQSKEMARLFLESTSPQRRQQLILKTDQYFNQTAIHWKAIRGLHEIVMAILGHCNEDTLGQLLTTKESLWGYHLLLSAGHGGNEEATMKIVELLIDVDMLEDAIEERSIRGETVFHYLVIHQLVGTIAEIMRRQPLQKRRKLLSLENDRGKTPKDLAMLPMRKYHSGHYDFYLRFSDLPVGLSEKTVELVHLLINEFSFSSPGVLTQCQMNHELMMSNTHLEEITWSGFSAHQVNQWKLKCELMAVQLQINCLCGL